MIEHTAGWGVEFQEAGGYDCMTAAYYIKAADGSMIAELDLRDYGQDNNGSYDVAAPRALPNALLMAAAPEYHEGICKLFEIWDNDGSVGEIERVIEELRPIYAKARGQS